MAHLPKIGSAISAIALAATLTGCAASLGTTSSARPQPGSADFALASRAQVALAKGDVATAVELAERAVELTPGDASLRGLLGNAYFAGGRFASAEAAYKDSLALAPNQRDLYLKVALVEIAQGKNDEALNFLASVRPSLDAADYGLAVALAGRPDEAVVALESAARIQGADSRVRQNLALSHGLAGNWEAARVIASQDLAPSLVDTRMAQWMSFAKPVQAPDQVAAMVGVTPNPADPGQPVRLALRRADENVQMASIETPVAPAPAPESVPEPAVASYASVYVPPAEASEPVVAAAAPVTEPAYYAPAAAEFEIAAPRSEASPAAASQLAEARKASAPKPKAKQSPLPRNIDSGVVVQIGAYSSPARVEKAWDMVSAKYASLRDYTPTSARFDAKSGTVYRLSVKGFASVGDAGTFCKALQRKGKSCFVRNTAGDSPVQFASR